MKTKPYTAPRTGYKPFGVNRPILRMPRRVQEWANLYTSGLTCDRIALETGWYPGRTRQRVGSASPATVRNELRKWGVPMRRQGGRGSIGSSLLVRVAELELQVKELTRILTEVNSR